MIAATGFRGQCGSETMSRSSHHHRDLAWSFRGAALDDIHRLRLRHGKATAAPTSLVGVCHKQVLQPRTVGASECASLAESEAHTNSGESTTGRDLCSKFSSGGNDLDQSIVSMTWRDFDILTQRRSSRPLKTMMPHVIRNENPAYYDLESTLVMDSKGLFDALDNVLLPQDDRKSAPRWCPHNRNAAADAMTKCKGAHSETLFTLLRTGMFTL